MDTSRTPSSVPEHESAPRLISPPGVGARHWQAVMTFFCLLLSYCLRVNLSVAIVAMTDTRDPRPDVTILPWDIAQKGVILSSMFWGYCILQIPAGHLSRIIGPKYLLFWAMVVCSSATILGPFIALQCDWLGFCVSRLVVGLAQGFFFPCVNSHIAKWAPPLERNRMFSFVFVGTQVGATLTMFVAGYLAASSWGWPSIFYVTGGCGLLWALMWLYVGADDPDSHSTISDGERAYIKSSLVNSSDQSKVYLYRSDNDCSIGADDPDSHSTISDGERAYIKSSLVNFSDQSKLMKTPWRDILTSAPVWAILIANLCQLWSYWTLNTMLPNYFDQVLLMKTPLRDILTSAPVWAILIANLCQLWSYWTLNTMLPNYFDQVLLMKTPLRDILTSAPVWAILIANLCQLWSYWTLNTMLPNYFDRVLLMKTPWRYILTSAPVWAILIANLCQLWSYWTLNTMLPNYCDQVLVLTLLKVCICVADEDPMERYTHVSTSVGHTYRQPLPPLELLDS
ncbi:hypothetical protein J6590_067904 [Homalodisca vitripennis]|nr:hypothetical protein J6590_067904 [Homalodisca vitripennis]